MEEPKEQKKVLTKQEQLALFEDRVKETINVLRVESKKVDGWDLSSDQNNIKIYIKNSEENPIKSAKAIGIVKQSPKAIFDLLQDLIAYKEVDKMYQKGRAVETFDEQNEIMYAHYSSGIMLVSDRDFCYYEGRIHEEDGTILIACFSVDREDTPEIDGIVRGHIFFSGWLLRPIQPRCVKAKIPIYGTDKWTEATFLAQVGPKGWIPTWIVNQASQEVGSSIANIQTFFKNKRKPKNPETETTTTSTGWFW